MFSLHSIRQASAESVGAPERLAALLSLVILPQAGAMKICYPGSP
jgi:hypothetical protein